MNHDIPDDIPNSTIEHCISEYVRLERDRAILRDHWFGGKSLIDLSNSYDLSLTAIKSVVYGQGDRVLIKATNL